MPAFYNEGIAFFSETDDYIENYEKIAKDHLQHQEGTGETHSFLKMFGMKSKGVLGFWLTSI